MRTIAGAPIPIYSWAPDLEPGAVQQAVHCAQLPVAFHHIAVMADGHQGYGVPIGAVMALRHAISPYAVGNDIGCGMAVVPTSMRLADLVSARDGIMGRIQATVPSGRDGHRGSTGGSANADIDPLLGSAFDAMEEAAARTGSWLSSSTTSDPGRGAALTRHDFVQRGRVQAGTLGSGNHFIELLADPEKRVWLMLHSGSRGVGSLVCNNFHRMALGYCSLIGQTLPDPGLAWLPMEGDDEWSSVGAAYERALRSALDYAEHNRSRMLRAVGGIVEERFPGAMDWDGMVNIHHNDAALEQHYGEQVWVHRKGAVKATPGASTITPGSMGTGTYLGRGLGNPESFSSCSHGAGRIMSRGQARRELSLAEQLATVDRAGGKVFATDAEAVLDEMPGAYKDLDRVMANQADLVEATVHLTPVATYKGADPPRRGKNRKQQWRPEEER